MTRPPELVPTSSPRLLVAALLLAALAQLAQAQEVGALVDEENAPITTDSTLSLNEAFEAAVIRAPGAALLAAAAEGARDAQARSRSLISGVPSVQLRYLSDRLQSRQGVTESEVGFDLPLWRWGQRQRVAEFAQASQQGVTEDQRLHRWQVAGAVRESYWEVREAQQRVDLARRDVEAFRALEADVGRRIAAGDAAPGERLIAEGQRVEREAVQHEAEVMLADRFFGWRTLTGLTVMPNAGEEREAPKVDSYLPLDAARATAARAEAALASARSEGAGSPRLLLGLRHDTQDGGADVDSLATQLTLPFGGGSHRQATLAPLKLEVARARDAVSQMERESQLAHHEAKHELHARETALADAARRMTLVVDELSLSRRAYSLGEIPLAERLLSELRAAEATRIHLLAFIAHSRAIARFNQINGVLP